MLYVPEVLASDRSKKPSTSRAETLCAALTTRNLAEAIGQQQLPLTLAMLLTKSIKTYIPRDRGEVEAAGVSGLPLRVLWPSSSPRVYCQLLISIIHSSTFPVCDWQSLLKISALRTKSLLCGTLTSVAAILPTSASSLPALNNSTSRMIKHANPAPSFLSQSRC